MNYVQVNVISTLWIQKHVQTHRLSASSTLKFLSFLIKSTLPSGNDSVLCFKAMYSAIFNAKGNNTTTFSIFHQQVQGKILNKVACIISQRLEEKFLKKRELLEKSKNQSNLSSKLFMYMGCLRIKITPNNSQGSQFPHNSLLKLANRYILP